MEKPIVRNYENQMLFIAVMKQELSRLTHQAECLDDTFVSISDLQKELKLATKITALAIKKLDEIISPVKLIEINQILNPTPTKDPNNLK